MYDINDKIDALNTCLIIFEKDEKDNGMKLYIHMNALCLCSNLMRIVNDVYNDITEYNKPLLGKIENVRKYIENTLRKNITNNFKNSCNNTIFHNNMHNYVKNKYDNTALLIKTELAFFSKYNLVKLIKILNSPTINEHINTLLNSSLNQNYVNRVIIVKNWIESLIKTIHEIITANGSLMIDYNDDRFLKNEETYRDEITILVDGYINKKYYDQKFGNDIPLASNESIGVIMSISFENPNGYSIKNLSKENKEKIIKSLMSQAEDELTRRLNM